MTCVSGLDQVRRGGRNSDTMHNTRVFLNRVCLQGLHVRFIVCLFVCFIASQHTLNQLRLQQYTTPTVYVSSDCPPLTVCLLACFASAVIGARLRHRHSDPSAPSPWRAFSTFGAMLGRVCACTLTRYPFSRSHCSWRLHLSR